MITLMINNEQKKYKKEIENRKYKIEKITLNLLVIISLISLISLIGIIAF